MAGAGRRHHRLRRLRPLAVHRRPQDPDDFATAWGGISSLQLGLPAVWTEARRRGHALEDVVRWMSARPGRPRRAWRRKGAIEAGRDADFAVLAPDETFTVDPAALQHRNRVTAVRGQDPARRRQVDLAARRTHRGGRRVHRAEGRLLTRPPDRPPPEPARPTPIRKAAH